MCYHKPELKFEQNVGDLTVQVFIDDDFGHLWQDLRGGADGCPIYFAAYSGRRSKRENYGARPDKYRWSGRFEEIEVESLAEPFVPDDEDETDPIEELRDPDILISEYTGPRGYDVSGFFYASRKALVKNCECATEEEAGGVFAEIVTGYESMINSLCDGEVYRYAIIDADGEHLDGCGGFLGARKFCEEQAIEEAKAIWASMAETAHVVEPYAAAGNGD